MNTILVVKMCAYLLIAFEIKVVEKCCVILYYCFPAMIVRMLEYTFVLQKILFEKNKCINITSRLFLDSKKWIWMISRLYFKLTFNWLCANFILIPKSKLLFLLKAPAQRCVRSRDQWQWSVFLTTFFFPTPKSTIIHMGFHIVK